MNDQSVTCEGNRHYFPKGADVCYCGKIRKKKLQHGVFV